MTYAERMILPALTPIIEANGGQLQVDAILEYVLVLVATGAFKDKLEIQQVFNDIYRRGLFNLTGGKRK